MKNILILILVLGIGVGAYFYFKNPNVLTPKDTTTSTSDTSNTVVEKPVENKPIVETTKGETMPVDTSIESIGKSVLGNTISAYHFGVGTKEILFVGGIHGGYEWNTVLLSYELIDYLKANPNVIPKNIRVTVIPVLNPDGLKMATGKTGRFAPSDVSTSEKIVISGRFNGNTVDINRNFDCDWKPSGIWQTTTVSGGANVFSEPESQAMRKYVESSKPASVVVWFSAGGGVYSSSCNNGILEETKSITREFANASKYSSNKSFDFYATTGDMVNWLAKIKIPAISVLLTNHTDTEWSKNQAGVLALFKYYAK